eukprot:scaffold1442_cov212-Alexandrium_tamarense.AAC.15
MKPAQQTDGRLSHSPIHFPIHPKCQRRRSTVTSDKGEEETSNSKHERDNKRLFGKECTVLQSTKVSVMVWCTEFTTVRIQSSHSAHNTAHRGRERWWMS